MRMVVLPAVCLIALMIVLLHGAPPLQADPESPTPPTPLVPQIARGVVFHDQNGNGTRDEGEPGIAGVCVSNQLQVTKTDEHGVWRLPVGTDTRVFVVKPRGWRPPVNADNLPRFHYNHKPGGSPASRFGGVDPTGDLPASIDFPLTPFDEPDTFTALFFADTQPYTIEQVDYVAHDVLEPLVGDSHGALFGCTLGDIVGDTLDLYGPLNHAVGRVGIPWYNVFGNHDANYDVQRDEDSDETFERVFAPDYYSWNVGKVHFIATDGVDQNGRRYIGHLGEKQLLWIKNDLAHVPDDHLVVVLMHIPLLTDGRGASVNVDDRHKLYRLLETRSHVLAIAGHMHRHDHRFIGKEDDWRGEKPLEQLYIATVSGNWWGGEKDARGIPDARMSDGAPNGYMIATFDGAEHSLRFQAASRPASYQMEIHAPHAIYTDRAEDAPLFVNVFAGSDRSTVELRIDNRRGEWSDWTPLKQVSRGGVPMRDLLAELGQPDYDTSTHLWRGRFPAGLPEGSITIQVRTTDCYGQVFTGQRIVRVYRADQRPGVVVTADRAPKLAAGLPAQIRVKNLRGDFARVLLPLADGEVKRVDAVRLGVMLRFGVPANVVPGRLTIEARNFARSDAQVFELVPGDGNDPRGLTSTIYRLPGVPKNVMGDYHTLMPHAIRRDATIDFGDRDAFGLPFDCESVAIDWRGWVNIPADGETGFTLESDDGALLFVNEERVLDNDGVHAKRAVSGSVSLPAGWARIRVVYFQGGGNAACRLLWTLPGTDDAAVIPADALRANDWAPDDKE